MKIGCDIAQIPGGYLITATLDTGDPKTTQPPRTVFCTSKAEAALKTAQLLAGFATFLSGMATKLAKDAGKKTKVVLPGANDLQQFGKLN